MSESDRHEDAAAYALSSLDAAELAEFEAHLAGCPVCQYEVAAFADTAAELSLLTEATPSPRLRANVLAAIQVLPQLPAPDEGDKGRGRPAAPVLRPSADGWDRAAPSGPRRALPGWEMSEEPEPRLVSELDLRRQRRRSRVLRGLVAAMLVVTVGLGGVIYTLVQQRQDQAAQIAQRFSEEQVVRAPDARLVSVKLDNGGVCTFVVSEQQNRGLFLGTNMPQPDPGLQYQLWTATGTPDDFSAVLDNAVPNARPWRQLFRGDLAEADLVAISIERQDTVPAEPTELVAVAKIPS